MPIFYIVLQKSAMVFRKINQS